MWVISGLRQNYMIYWLIVGILLFIVILLVVQDRRSIMYWLKQVRCDFYMLNVGNQEIYGYFMVVIVVYLFKVI